MPRLKYRIIILFMFRFIFCCILKLALGLDAPVTWVADSYMRSGVIQAITSYSTGWAVNSTTSSRVRYQYQVTFNTTFTTDTSVNMGIISLQVDVNTSDAIFLINDHDNRTATGFVYYLTINSTNHIANLKINYLCLDEDQLPALQLRRIVADPTDPTYLLDFDDTSTGTGYRQTNFPVSYTDPINMSHDIILIVFVKAFGMRALAGGLFTMGIKIELLDSYTADVTIWTSGTCKLFYSEYYSLLVDKTQVEVTQKYFMDDGTIEGSLNVQTTDAVIEELVDNGYIFGANFFSLNFSSGLTAGFDVAIGNCTVNAVGSGYSYVNISYFNYRIRGCPGGTPYYYQQNQLCYDSCPVQSYPNTTYNFCYPCNTPCYTCPNATNCSSCNSTQSFRVLSGATCVCMPGYYETNLYVCGTCIDGCVTCANNSSCTTCNASAGYLKVSGICVCNSTSYSENEVCNICSAVLLGCSQCSNSTACSSCLNSNYTYDSSSSLCDCSVGYTLISNGPSSFCQACSQLVVGCLECDSTTTCTKCSPQFDHVGTECVCPDGTYLDTSSTPTCTKCDMSCLTCTDGTGSSCTSCASFLIYDSEGHTCSCSNRDQVTNGTACVSCSTLCDSLLCTGVSDSPCQACGCPCQHGYYQPSISVTLYMWINLYITLPQPSADCLVCDTSDLLSLSVDCTCPVGMYPDPSNSNNSCLPCDYTCLMCSSSTNTSCTRCNDTDLRTLKSSSCPCNPFYMDAKNGSTLCITLVCDLGYSITSDGYCAPICGDGLVAPEEQCDDNNTITGDGCSNDCKTQQNYTCSGNLTTSSVCSYNQPIQIQVVSITKDPTSNNLTYTINIAPNITSLNNVNFSEVLDLGLPNDTIITYKYQNGVLTAEAQYFQNLQSLPTNITFNPSGSNAPVFQLTPETVSNYTVEPTNNLAADVYPEEVYKQADIIKFGCLGVVGLTFLTYAVGIYSGKLIGTQMIWVVQLAFMGMLILDFSDPLYEPMRNLMFSNGFSIQLTNVQTNMPKRISSLGYFNSLINNFNLMIGLELAIAIVSVSLFIASKVVKDDALKTKLLSYSKLSIGEFMITAVLLQIYQYGVSTCILCQYPYEKGMMFYVSIAEAGLFGGCVVALLVLYALKTQDIFGEYKTFFKETKIGQYFYFIPIGCRIGISFALGVLNGVLAGGIIVIGILAVELIVTVALRPYLKKKHTIRECVNLGVGIVIIALYVFFGKRIVSGLTNLVYYVPYLILGLLAGIVIMNLTFIILNIVEGCRSKRKMIQESLQKKQNQQLANFQQETKKMLVVKKAPQFRRKLKSNTPKIKPIVESTITTGLLTAPSQAVQPLSRAEQFENSLYPMMENEAINLQDIELEPFWKKSRIQDGVEKIDQVQQQKYPEQSEKEQNPPKEEAKQQPGRQQQAPNSQEMDLKRQSFSHSGEGFSK